MSATNCITVGFNGVDPRWEWNPALLAVRELLEAPFEAALRGSFPADTYSSGLDVRAGLTQIADHPGSASSRYPRDTATRDQFLEVLVLRSAYRPKEADPHSFAIPRLENKAKAALVEIEYDEFGSGRADRIHAVLYQNSMNAAGVDSRYGALTSTSSPASRSPPSTPCHCSGCTAGSARPQSETSPSPK